MRIRAIKPGFFKNEHLAELSPLHRLCFAGLWCCADREGRVEDRPKRLKAEIFPYDDVDMDHLLWDLARVGFIRRYVIGQQPLISIPSWYAHQHPRQDEAQSELGAYIDGTDRPHDSELKPYQVVRDAVTGPSLSRDQSAVVARMGNGDWEVGTGKWEVGNGDWDNGSRAGNAAPHVRAQDLVDLWNATIRPPFPKVHHLTDERRRKIRTRIAHRPNLAEWRDAFEALLNLPFYRGENDRQWVADFDWMIRNDTQAAKVLERAKTQRPQPTSKLTQKLASALVNISEEAS